MALRRTRVLLCLALLSLTAPAAPGQDEPAAAEPGPEAANSGAATSEAEDAPSEPQAVTTADPGIPVDHLQLLLRPLTVEELEVEAEAWRDLVKSSVQEIAEASIASRQTGEQKAGGENDGAESDAQNGEVPNQLSELEDSKTRLLNRFDAVLTAYEKKGGDASQYRTYAAAVSGLDLKDTRASLSAIRSWLTSEERGIKWAFGIAKFLVIMAIFWIVSAILAKLVRRMIDRRRGLSDLLKRFINKLVRRTILFVGLLVALSTIGVNVGALLALIGGGAFIIGFALQDTLGNFAAGLMLLFYRPFDVGDAVEVGGVSGKVDNVSLVNTTILTFDNKVVLVPNKSVWGQVITNATASDQRRVDMVFGIGYGDDIEKAQSILERILKEHELVFAEPEPAIKVNELGASSVNFICRPWCKTEDYWTVFWDVTRRVKAEFDANGISIPFPQQDVHLHKVE